ncbi:hypothetical protein ACJRO7_015835 [Eucalyptus globulus]|uniref:Uncharacterized protein n=1 Tax=Eucalyptus globulus TaxID=34317 RepID=A0ABD3LAN2_EUCGL
MAVSSAYSYACCFDSAYPLMARNEFSEDQRLSQLIAKVEWRVGLAGRRERMTERRHRYSGRGAVGDKPAQGCSSLVIPEHAKTKSGVLGLCGFRVFLSWLK